MGEAGRGPPTSRRLSSGRYLSSAGFIHSITGATASTPASPADAEDQTDQEEGQNGDSADVEGPCGSRLAALGADACGAAYGEAIEPSSWTGSEMNGFVPPKGYRASTRSSMSRPRPGLTGNG